MNKLTLVALVSVFSIGMNVSAEFAPNRGIIGTQMPSGLQQAPLTSTPLGNRVLGRDEFKGNEAPLSTHSVMGNEAPPSTHSVMGNEAPPSTHSVMGNEAPPSTHSVMGNEAPPSTHALTGNEAPPSTTAEQVAPPSTVGTTSGAVRSAKMFF